MGDTRQDLGNKTTEKVLFAGRESVEQVEEGDELAPKFGSDGLMPVVTSDFASGEILMLGYVNEEAVALTLATGEAHYYSRARQAIWHKGATSGMLQLIKEVRVDDDQDALWFRVEVTGDGASCHVGYRSCFFRRVSDAGTSPVRLEKLEADKVFDPTVTYKDAPNPTSL